ncbi:MAG: hypothetical protein ACPGID_02560 [Rubricella sp.]
MLKKFFADESGAVTVDFVVLCAAVVAVAAAIIGVLQTGLDTAADNVSTSLSDQTAN